MRTLFIGMMAFLLVGRAEATCVSAKPLVVMSSARVDAEPGATGIVDATITNQDSGDCDSRGFILQASLGYYGGLTPADIIGHDIAPGSPRYLFLAPGASGTVTVQVMFTPTAPSGRYVSLLFHVYPDSDDPLVYFYQSGFGRTEFYVAPQVCLSESTRDTLCAILCGGYQ